MPNDYLKKEPSKTEKMLYELAIAQRQMEKGLWSTSTVVMALAILTKTKPEDLAGLMANDEAKIKEYSEKVNATISSINKQKNPGQEERHNHSH